MSDNLGGIEKYIFDLYNNIDKEKIQFDFLINGKNGKICYQNQINQDTSNFIDIESRSKNYFKFLKDLKYLFSHSNYDYIHIHLMSLSYFEPILYAHKYSRAKIILHSHVNDFSSKKFVTKILNYIGKKFIRNIPSYKVACSTESWKYMFDKFNNLNEKEIIFKNGINPKKFIFSNDKRVQMRRQLSISNDTFVVGNVGRFSIEKNQLFLIDVFTEILKINSNSKLLLIGQGELLEQLKNKIRINKIEDKVIFTGIVNNVNDYMQAMDVFILPSLYEGLGIVLIESQASGLLTFSSKENISQETKITELIKFISLKESPSYWAKQIVAGKNYIRKDMQKQIISKGRIE